MKKIDKSLIATGLGTILIVFASAFPAAAESNWYLKGSLSYAHPGGDGDYEADSLNFLTDPSRPTYKGNGSFGEGGGFDIAIGYRIAPLLRAEAELGYYTAKWSPSNVSRYSTKFKNLSLMGNLFFEIPASETVTPFFGGGIGMVHSKNSTELIVTEQVMTDPGDDTVDPPVPPTYENRDITYSYNAKTWVPGAQAIAGIAFKLPSNIELLIEYNFIMTDDPESEVPLSAIPGNEPAFKEKYGYTTSHHIGVGIRLPF